MSRSYCLFYYNINLLFSSFSNSSPTNTKLFYNQHNAIYSLQQWNTVKFGLWSWFSCFERKGSWWKICNQLPGTSAGSLVFVVVPKTRVLDNHLPRVPITPNQQGAIEMREEVLSKAGAQDTDTGEKELSDLEDIDFSWEDPAVDMNSVYRPGLIPHFPHPSLTFFGWDQPLPTQ